MDFFYKNDKVDVNTASPAEVEGLEEYFEEVTPNYGCGFFWSTSGVLTDWDHGVDWKTGEPVPVRCLYTLTPIEVYGGQKLKLASTRMLTANVPTLVFFDENMNVVKSDMQVTNEYDYVVPEKAKYLHLNIQRADGKIYVKLNRYGKDPSPIVNELTRFDLMNEIESNHRNFLASKKTMKPNEKAYIIMRFDDGLPDLDLAHEIFSAKGIPILSAFIAKQIYTISRGGVWMKDVLKSIVEDGGEVCAHNSGPLTDNNRHDFEKLYYWFAETKRLITQYDINVDGIIASGGKDEFGSTVLTASEIEKWSAFFYSYSNEYGTNPPYHVIDTWNLGTQLPKDVDGFMTGIRAKVNEIISEKKAVFFLTHNIIPKAAADTSYVDEQCMRVLAEYLPTLNSDEVEITTMRDYMRSHYYYV